MSERPNILLITTDQQRFDTIAALGNQEIYTPHLDWLVDEGICYTNAYTDCPICMPARATIMTGKCGYTMGLTGNRNDILPLQNNTTLPEILTANGYQTRAQGKMHFHPMRANYGFEHMELPMDYYRECHRNENLGLPKQHGVGENEITPVISTVPEEKSLTHWTVKRSIDFLETRDETRPFFLWTSFTKPHPPFDPCANYWSLYSNREVSEPTYGDWSGTLEDVPQGYMKPTYTLNNAYRMSARQMQDVKRAYYACITQIDYQLGLLFARLREMELLENTWIIFTTDHGEMLGDHQMGAKAIPFEGSAHIPLMIRPPAGSWDEKPLAGKKEDAPVNLSDIMPTILKIAGIAVPDDLDGNDLLTPASERTLFINCDKYYAVIKNKVKLTWTSIGGDYLMFDLNKDPHEQHNIVESAEYTVVYTDLQQELVKHLQQYAPQCLDGNTPKSLSEPQTAAKSCKWPGFHSTVFPTDVLH